MLGLIYLAAFETCGVITARRLLRRYGRMTQLWLGMALGLMMLMWFPSLFAFGMRFSYAAHGCALGLAAAFTATAHFWPRQRIRPPKDASEPPVWLVLTVVLPLTLLMAYMQYTHNIPMGANGAIMTGQSTYGDLNLHLGIASGLRDAAYPPEYTILPGTLLGYPFLMDALSGSLHLLGTPLQWAFTIPGTLMSALVFWGFVMLAWEMTHEWRAVLVASALMFFNGGLGFVYALDGVFKDPSRFLAIFTGFYQAPANLVDYNIRWVNVLVDMMLPQRTILAGWCVVIPALWLLMRCLREKDWKLFLMLGVWAGAMPMIHSHSFLALGMISVGVMGVSLWRVRNGDWMNTLVRFLIYGGVAVLLALPQLITWTFPQTVNGGSLAIRPNWVNWDGSGLIDEYFWFWIKNVGPVYLVMIPAACVAGRRQKAMAVGALLVYIVAELIQFQPNPYDNNKLFYVAFMVMLPMAAQYLVLVWDKLREVPGRRILAAAFLGVSLLSGALSVVRECVSEYELYGAGEVEAAQFIAENAPQDAVVLTGTQHNNPISSLTGRKIVCGTSSFLYYHGLDYAAQEQAVRRMYQDPEGSAELFEEYGVDYIYISSHERANYAPDQEFISTLYPLVFDNGSVRVWAVSERAQAVIPSITSATTEGGEQP